MPGLAAYCGSKALVSTFGEALSFEVREYMDVTVWDCGHVQTKLGGNYKGRTTLTPEEAVSDALRHLGKSRRTKGSFKTQWSNSLLKSLFCLSCCGNKAADAFRRSYDKKQSEK